MIVFQALALFPPFPVILLNCFENLCGDNFSWDKREAESSFPCVECDHIHTCNMNHTTQGQPDLPILGFHDWTGIWGNSYIFLGW